MAPAPNADALARADAKRKADEDARIQDELLFQERKRKADEDARFQQELLLREQKRKADEERLAALRKQDEANKAGRIIRDCPECPELVALPAGSFMMGSASYQKDASTTENPVRRVTFTRPFAVGKYEVTFAEWDACVSAGGCRYSPGDEGWGRGRRPVMNVSWNDIAFEYLPWLSRRTGKAYRLLTEAEWEYVVTRPIAFHAEL